MHKVVIAVAGAAAGSLLVTGWQPATADIMVNVSKTSQRMSVLVDGTSRYNWTISTGAKRYTTPSGVYKPQWLARKWRSKQYNNAPMPHSIFFHEGYAIHGTTEVAQLGKIASHGCVRLHPDNAAKLYELVQKHMANTRVVVSDDVIESPGSAPKKKPSQIVAQKPATEKPAAEKPAIQKPAAEKPTADRRAADKPAADAGAAPETAALAAIAAGAENSLVADHGFGRIAKPKPARMEKIARARSGGFHW